MASTSMITCLPTEILHEICASLCTHCRLLPGTVVNASPEIRALILDDQKSLASLSRCCKLLQQIAQPTLFHMFDVDKTREEGNEINRRELMFMKFRDRCTADRRQASFVRALIQRPDLRKQVHALSIYLPQWDSHWSGEHGERAFMWQESQEAAAVAQAVAALAVTFIGEGQFLSRVPPRMDAVIVALCRETVTQLCLELRFCLPGCIWTMWDLCMPNLRHLVLPGAHCKWGDTYHIKETRNLIKCAPRLSTVIAADCNGGKDLVGMRRHYLYKEPWGQVTLHNLRRLSLNGIGTRDLADMLLMCHSLEDLEYFPGEPSVNVMDVRAVLDPVKHTLRRLCYSTTGQEPFKGSEFQSREGYYSSEKNTRSFAWLEKLEVLETDRLLLYGLDEGQCGPHNGDSNEEALDLRMFQETSSDQFLGRLPRGIRKLRIGFIHYWPAMFRDAVALAERATVRFPNLTETNLLMEEEPPKSELDEVVSLFSGSGIAMRATSSNMYYENGYLARGLLPPRPGASSKAEKVYAET